MTCVPVVPKTSFWYQKKRKEIVVTYLKGFTPIGMFSIKKLPLQKIAVVDPPLVHRALISNNYSHINKSLADSITQYRKPENRT